MSRFVSIEGHPIEETTLVDATGQLIAADDTDGQPIIFAKARNYVWDTNTLAWVRETQPGAGGGGGPVTIVDGGDVTLGTIADVAVTGDSAGTVNAHLRGIDKLLAATLTVSGTVTANAGTNLNTSALALEAGGNLANISGSVVAQSTGLGTVKNQLISGSVTTNVPTYITGNINPLSLDTSGLLRTSLKDTPSNTNNFNVNLAASAATVTVSGTVTANQGGSPWGQNLTQIAGTTLGATAVTNFGTAPAAVAVPGVNASLFIGTTVAVASSAGVQKVGISGSAGAAMDAAGQNAVSPVNELLVGGQFNTTPTTITTGNMSPLQVNSKGELLTQLTDGTTNVAVIAGTTALKTDLSSVAGTAATTAAAGTLKVGIVGNAGATVDSTIGAATAPTNAITIAAVNNTTAPSLTTGQAIAMQADYEGSVFVKPYRRAQTVTKATTIASSSSATTVLAAQAAGIFADISNLVITVTPAATADIGFTATLSDGTNSFIYDMDTGALATATADPTTVNINFNPPLPATTAATAWTIALSVATVTVHITVVVVLQKAS